MKVFYVGSDLKKLTALKASQRTFLMIGWDKWDDFGFKTLLPCRLFVEGVEVVISNIRILLEDSSFTAKALDDLVALGWNGVFPIPGIEYVSVPSDVDFYRVIYSSVNEDSARQVAELLRDAGYLKNVLDDQTIVPLLESKGFDDSLMREGGSRKAFTDGHNVFILKSGSRILDFVLNIQSNESVLPIAFKFNSTVLPYDINVLIGPNGIGKSHCLQILVEYWLKIERGAPNALRDADIVPFDNYPNISKLILVSYSPFEDFILDLSETNLDDKDAYQYFGFRRASMTESGKKRIGISRNLPASDAARSILRCVVEDARLGFLNNWVNKFSTAVAVLAEAVDFDWLALAIRDDVQQFDEISEESDDVISIGKKRYLKLTQAATSKLVNYVDLDVDEGIFNYLEGVVFISNDRVVKLSSGQRLFSYIVINVLGAIKMNSLVVVDEPELFLHPTLEVMFISLLKTVLDQFSSKAILATHSLVSVRETPRNCVHVFRKTEYGREVIQPPFETFGGDIQRISSYVFGDRLISKPYIEWISKKIKEYESADDFIAALQGEVNEELVMRIKKLAEEI